MKKCNQEGCSKPAQLGQNRCAPCRNGIQRYGLNRPQQLEMLACQDNKCLICHNYLEFSGKRHDQSSACIDHCHLTGKVRGVLCGNCNTLLHHFDERNIDVNDIVKYLKQ